MVNHRMLNIVPCAILFLKFYFIEVGLQCCFSFCCIHIHILFHSLFLESLMMTLQMTETAPRTRWMALALRIGSAGE